MTTKEKNASIFSTVIRLLALVLVFSVIIASIILFRHFSTDESEFVDNVASLGKELGLEIHAMHEDIFDSMHKI